MPNWCYTDITIYHNDEEKLKAFFDKIEEWRKKPFKKNDFDKYSMGWLGNIVGNSGIAEWKKVEEREDFVPAIDCRGSIQTLMLDNRRILITTETAWGPMLKMWQKVCDKYLPDAEIIFTAEESGCEIYVTNDPDMIGMYYIDIFEPPEGFEDEESVYECDANEVIEFLQRVLKTEETDFDKLIKMSESIEEPWFSIHEWKESDISQCL